MLKKLPKIDWRQYELLNVSYEDYQESRQRLTRRLNVILSNCPILTDDK